MQVVEVLVEVTIVDEVVLAGAMEEDEAVLAGTTFCDVVLEGFVGVPLFVPRYMTRPIITTIAMTIAATTAAATPARDSSNLISYGLTSVVLVCHNSMPKLVQNTLLKWILWGTPTTF
jgi:hypothetical protein